jgi:hypothetical protein
MEAMRFVVETRRFVRGARCVVSSTVILTRVGCSLICPIVLHRITALLVICVGLLFPGLSALACCSTTAPMHDCCPFGQRSPGQDPASSVVELAAGIETCCTASVANAATIISTADTHTVRKQQQRPDPLALLASVVLHVAVEALPPSNIGRDFATYRPSYSTLYLSSGRLRL